MPDFIDIHSHVHFPAYDTDRDDVTKRALEKKVWMINVGTQHETSQKAVKFAEQHQKGVYAVVGLHPTHTGKSFHDKNEIKSESLSLLGEEFDYDFYKKLASNPKVVAIGECGLDYYRCAPDTEKKQREVFSSQIALANEVGKPLMLHVRSGSGKSAYRDAVQILKSEAKVSGNFHFFAGNLEEAKEILDIGFSVSFTGVVTFSRDYDEVIQNIPLERIMSETDCPYVAPTPYRGKRNEPLYVQETVKKIAEIRGEDFEKVRHILVQNALNTFNLSNNTRH